MKGKLDMLINAIRPNVLNNNVSLSRKINSRENNLLKLVHFQAKDDKNFPYYTFYVTIDANRGTMNKEKQEEYEKIVSSLLFYDYDTIVEQLIAKQEFAASRELVYVDEEDPTKVNIHLYSHDSTMSDKLEKKYTIPEFLEIMEELEKNSARKRPEDRDKYKECTQCLREFLSGN